jgi:hypothetical protein
MTGLLLASHLSTLARRCCRANGLATVAYFEIMDNSSVSQLLLDLDNLYYQDGNADAIRELSQRKMIRCWSRSQNKSVIITLGDMYAMSQMVDDGCCDTKPARVVRIRRYGGMRINEVKI